MKAITNNIPPCGLDMDTEALIEKNLSRTTFEGIKPGERFKTAKFHTPDVELKVKAARVNNKHVNHHMDQSCVCETCGNWGLTNSDNSYCFVCDSDDWEYNFERVK